MAIVPLECVVSAEGQQVQAQKRLPEGLDKDARLKALIERVKMREHRR